MKIKIEKVIELLAYNPAKIYKIKNKGQIKIGFDADITIIDINKTHVIRNKDMAYKCGWTPFDGMKIKGKVYATIVSGNIKMINDKVIGTPNGKMVEFYN